MCDELLATLSEVVELDDQIKANMAGVYNIRLQYLQSVVSLGFGATGCS